MPRTLLIIILLHFSLVLKAQTIRQSDTIPFLESKPVLLSNSEEISFQVQNSFVSNPNSSFHSSARHTLGYRLRRPMVIRDSIYDLHQRRTDPLFLQKYGSISPRKPLIALGLSLVIPGAGQVYNKQYIAGGCFFVSELLLVGKIYTDSNKVKNGYDDSMIGGLVIVFEGMILTAIHLSQAIDAPIHAHEINSRLSRIKNRNHVSMLLSPVFLRQERNIGSILPSNSSFTSTLTPGLSLALRW